MNSKKSKAKKIKIKPNMVNWLKIKITSTFTKGLIKNNKKQIKNQITRVEAIKLSRFI